LSSETFPLGVDQPDVLPAEVEDAANEDKQTEQVGNEDAPQQAPRDQPYGTTLQQSHTNGCEPLPDGTRRAVYAQEPLFCGPP